MANMSLPLGAPRTPRPRFQRPVRSDIVFPIETPFSSQDPTVLTRPRKTTYRVGVEAPAKSSLPVFIFIGVAVGLLAFVVMSFCPPTHARAAVTPVVVDAPAAFAPAPVLTAMAVAELPAAPEPVAPAKPTRHRRASKSKKASVPVNPYLASN